jgi:hypothetical protein
MLDADKSPAFATLEGLCDRLFGAEAWDAYVVTSRAVQRATLEADGELAALDRLPAKLPRFLVKSAEAKGGDALNDALATAHRALPRDAALALRYAKTLEDAGDRAGALATLSSALGAAQDERPLRAR